MAQRAIREKTKQRISQLEAIIDHLQNSDHNKELQAAIRAKEAAEAENAEIKRQLADLIAKMQGLAAPRHLKEEEHVYATPASQTCVSINTLPAAATSIVSPPDSATSPAGTNDGHAQDTGQHDYPPAVHQHMPALAQQKQDMERELKIGRDRVSLDFLVNNMHSDVPTHITRGAGSGSDTAGGSRGFQSYDSSPAQYHGSMQPPSTAQRAHSFQHHSISQAMTMQAGSYHPHPAASPYRPDTHYTSHSRQEQPVWATTTLNQESTCTMDGILLQFLKDRRDLLARGLPRLEVMGPPSPSVASLLNKADCTSSHHPISEFFTAIIRTFPNLSSLPEQLGTVYLMFLNMRWQVEPTRENYDRLLPFTRPVPLQRTVPHPAWMDQVPFPLMRDRMIRDLDKYNLDEFFVPYTNTLSVNWPYGNSCVLTQRPGTKMESNEAEITINPVFDQHVRNLDNWTVGDEFKRKFPELEGTYNLKEGPRRSDVQVGWEA